MTTLSKYSCAALSCFVMSSLTADANEIIEPRENTLSTELQVAWDSRYFSEGRDNLDGDSLLSTTVELGWKDFTAGIWYADSPDSSYNELQLSLTYTKTLGDFEFYLSYTRLEFPFEDAHDDELGVGVVWSGLPLGLEFSADYYYSLDADGYFCELGLGRDFEVSDSLTASLSSAFGINQGYIPDGHDGANHFALSAGIEYAVTQSFAITAYTTYSWAIDSDSDFAGDDQLEDFFLAGVALKWSF